MRVLVTYGSKRGGTEGIARILGEALQRKGLEVRVLPASEAGDPGEYDGVVVGGALYATRWHRHARRFVSRYAKTLQTMPVWFFSSGPLDESASRSEIPPTRQVKALMARVGAREHVTFGGRLEKDATGFIAKSMAAKMAGDWRDTERINAWGQTVARGVLEAPRRVPVRVQTPAPLRWLLVTLCLFAGLTAIGGGLTLLAAPDGSIVQMPLSALKHTPFTDFTIPGLLLFGVVGLLNTLAGILLLRRHPLADREAFVSGGAMTLWIVAEMIFLRSFHWLQLTYLIVGLAIQTLALMRIRREAPPTRARELPGGHPVSP